MRRYKEIDVTEAPFLKKMQKEKQNLQIMSNCSSKISPFRSSDFWVEPSVLFITNKVPKTYLDWVLPSVYFLLQTRHSL